MSATPSSDQPVVNPPSHPIDHPNLIPTQRGMVPAGDLRSPDQPTDGNRPARNPMAIVGVVALVVLALLGFMWVADNASNTSTFLGKMHNSPYGTHDNSDGELVVMGRNVCGAFDNGKTVKQIAESFWGMSYEQRGFLMGAAVSSLCTEHLGSMQGQFNAYNGY